MIDSLAAELGVSNGVVWGLLAFSLVAMAIQVWALVDLARRNQVMGGRKWVWALVILLLNNALGAILYFAIGRRVPEPIVEQDQPHTTAGDRTRRAVDALYGAPTDEAP